MICSLIEHGFLPVFSIERKVMLYSNIFYTAMDSFLSKLLTKFVPAKVFIWMNLVLQNRE